MIFKLKFLVLLIFINSSLFNNNIIYKIIIPNENILES